MLTFKTIKTNFIMKTYQLLMTGAIAVLLFGSCKKSSSDDASASSSTVQVQLKVANPLVVVNLIEGPGSILWTSGSATATQVKLEAKQNASQLEFKSTGLQQIDLFASVLVSLGNIVIPAGNYTEVEFRISLNQNGSSSAMDLNGQYTNGTTGVITPVAFSLNGLFELKTEQSNVAVTGSGSITALTTLNLAFVSNGITQAMLNSATITNGKIIISASSNSNLYNLIINNLQQTHHVDVTHH
jgi:hypothetical protein